MSEDTILEFVGISKAFGGIQALEQVSLSLGRGEILGLIGENGAGKTTLMNVLGGVVMPNAGEIRLGGEPYEPTTPRDAIDAGIAFIHQELNLFTNLSVAENLFIDRFPRLGGLLIDRRKLGERSRPVIEAVDLEISPFTKIETMAPGERQLVEIGKALVANAQIIIFDEPTTSLTAKETAKLFGLIKQLRDDGKSIIYISHILGDVLELADEVAVLRDGKLIGQGAKHEFTTRKMISMMVGRDIEKMFPEKTSSPQSGVALECREVEQPGIVRDISFQLHKGEVLGIFGLMGSGRTEMVRIVYGLDPVKDGQMLVGGVPLRPLDPIQRIKRNIAFVTEDRRDEGLLMDSTIAENLGLVNLRQFVRSFTNVVDTKAMYGAAESMKSQLRIKSDKITKATAKSLSGGNQQKVVIGKWLITKPEVLILDEPTRGIDVGAKFEVYSIVNNLAANGTAVLMISSELEELIGMCDRIIVMSRGEITGEFERAEFDQESILAAAFRETIAMETGEGADQ